MRRLSKHLGWSCTTCLRLLNHSGRPFGKASLHRGNPESANNWSTLVVRSRSECRLIEAQSWSNFVDCIQQIKTLALLMARTHLRRWMDRALHPPRHCSLQKDIWHGSTIFRAIYIGNSSMEIAPVNSKCFRQLEFHFQLIRYSNSKWN